MLVRNPSQPEGLAVAKWLASGFLNPQFSRKTDAGSSVARSGRDDVRDRGYCHECVEGNEAEAQQRADRRVERHTLHNFTASRSEVSASRFGRNSWPTKPLKPVDLIARMMAG